MSDDFDLLETDDSSKQKQEKVDVNWGKAVDQMKSKLAQEDDPEMRQKILNATLDDVVGMAEQDRTSLLDAIKDLTDYQDEVGIIFEKFSTLNADEQKIIDNSQKALERAKIELGTVCRARGLLPSSQLLLLFTDTNWAPRNPRGHLLASPGRTL